MLRPTSLSCCRYLASDSADESDDGEEEWAFEGPRPPKRGERASRLAALLDGSRAGEAAEDGDHGEMGMEMTFDSEPAKGGRANSRAKLDADPVEEDVLPTVFEVEEAKRKARRREKRALFAITVGSFADV